MLANLSDLEGDCNSGVFTEFTNVQFLIKIHVTPRILQIFERAPLNSILNPLFIIYLNADISIRLVR